MLSRTFTLGRYTCVERIGVTPIGEQWRAKRFGLIGVERQYLVTKLHPQLVKDSATFARLTTALRSYAELDQDGLLRFFEQGSHGADHYAVFEFVGYADLRKLKAGLELAGSREKSSLLPAIVVALGQELTATLARAHERGLYHGMLSPQSVWLDGEGGVHLADVGLLPALPTASWANDASLKAAYPYMAPELQISSVPTEQSDVYSLGMVLQELLGGLTIATASAEAAPILAGLSPVLLQATARVASGRFATIAAMQQALESVALPMPEAVRSALQQVGQQFQMAGDTVPQPVVISERSSAEPLPPPPTGRVLLGKSGPTATRARNQASRPGLAGDDALNLAADGTRSPGGSAGTGARPDEDTPLPMSRPLLVTNPKISVSAGADDATGLNPAGDDAAGRPRTGGNEKISRSAAGRPPSGTQPAAASPARAASQSGPPAPKTGRAAPSSRPASPVTINPKAQFGGELDVRSGAASGGLPQSATTPTVDVVAAVQASGAPIDQPLSLTADAGTPAPAKNAGSTSASPGAAPDAAASMDKYSLESTNPALAPVRVKPGAPSQGAGATDEPTNQLSADEARALADADMIAVAVSGAAHRPISVPGQDTALAAAMQQDAAVRGPADQAAEVPAPAADGGNALAEDRGSQSALKVAAARRKTTMLAVLGLVGLIGGGGLTYLLTRSDSRSGGPAAGADGGAGAADAYGSEHAGAAAKAKVPPGELRLSSEPAADVYIDGESRGHTPVTLPLPPGPHKLLLIAEEYGLLRREVTGGTELSLRLERAKLPEDVAGRQVVKIKCKTKGELRILVDGNDTGLSCPTETLAVAPGRHTFGFLRPATEELQEKQQKVKGGKSATKFKVKF